MKVYRRQHLLSHQSAKCMCRARQFASPRRAATLGIVSIHSRTTRSTEASTRRTILAPEYTASCFHESQRRAMQLPGGASSPVGSVAPRPACSIANPFRSERLPTPNQARQLYIVAMIPHCLSKHVTPLLSALYLHQYRDWPWAFPLPAWPFHLNLVASIWGGAMKSSFMLF